MTGPRFTVRTVCGLLVIGLCIAAVAAVCMAINAYGASR